MAMQLSKSFDFLPHEAVGHYSGSNLSDCGQVQLRTGVATGALGAPLVHQSETMLTGFAPESLAGCDAPPMTECRTHP